MKTLLALIIALGAAQQPATPPAPAHSAPITAESIDHVYWCMRSYLARHVADALKDAGVRRMQTLPYAPAHLQALWSDAQTKVGIPTAEQKPLRINTELINDIYISGGMGAINPMLTLPAALSEAYGSLYCILLYGAATIKITSSNASDHELCCRIMGHLDDRAIVSLYQALLPSITAHNTSAILEQFSLLVPCAGTLQAAEEVRLEQATHTMMLAHIDCEQCLHDFISFDGVNQRINEISQSGDTTVAQRLRELQGKKCAWHSVH